MNRLCNVLFQIYEKRLQSPQFPLESLATGPQSQQNSLILGRNWGAHTLNSIRTRVLAQCKLAQQTRTLADVISEDHVPDVATLGAKFNLTEVYY